LEKSKIKILFLVNFLLGKRTCDACDACVAIVVGTLQKASKPHEPQIIFVAPSLHSGKNQQLKESTAERINVFVFRNGRLTGAQGQMI
jgi:hypothetical protein